MRVLWSELKKKRELNLSDISPTLFSILKFKVSIPGNSDVIIKSFLPTVVGFPTKTKPKKITMIGSLFLFLGSDDKSYSFLIKGNEELKLDDRISQFVSFVDSSLNGALGRFGGAVGNCFEQVCHLIQLAVFLSNLRLQS